jgi:hypothetical protein
MSKNVDYERLVIENQHKLLGTIGLTKYLHYVDFTNNAPVWLKDHLQDYESFSASEYFKPHLMYVINPDTHEKEIVQYCLEYDYKDHNFVFKVQVLANDVETLSDIASEDLISYAEFTISF